MPTPYIVPTQCPLCTAWSDITIDYAEWRDYEDDGSVPSSLDTEEYRMLDTGVCPSCWEQFNA